MPDIRLAFCDLAPDWDPADNYFTRVLRAAGVSFTLCAGPQDAPDYVLCGTFGHDFLQYRCCRILYSGEDSWPDFNLYDYAMGFPHMDCGDRYLRLPLYAMRDTWAAALCKHEQPDEYFTARKGFCACVVSNGDGAARNALFEAISAHRPVGSGGAWRNNVGGPVADKTAFQRGYKFALACENSADPGYCTEKIVDAWAAGCVPVYWGDPLIKGEFDPAAFVNAADYPDTAALLAALDALDADDDAYLAVCHTPILRADSRAAAYRDGGACAAFLQAIFAKGPAGAICRNRSGWGQNYENDLRHALSLVDKARQPGLLGYLLRR